jgi:hypothetical protein
VTTTRPRTTTQPPPPPPTTTSAAPPPTPPTVGPLQPDGQTIAQVGNGNINVQCLSNVTTVSISTTITGAISVSASYFISSKDSNGNPTTGSGTVGFGNEGTSYSFTLGPIPFSDPYALGGPITVTVLAIGPGKTRASQSVTLTLSSCQGFPIPR